jgi:signal transduction histidine kinase
MKLLNRTVRNYGLYSAALLLVFSPIFYLTIHDLFTHEMDRILRSHKDDFITARPYLSNASDLHFFQLMNKEFVLHPAQRILIKDSLYTENLYDSAIDEMKPHRILKTGVHIGGQPYDLLIRESMVSNRSLIAAIVGVQLLLVGLLVAGLVLINHYLARIVWNPFYSILENLRKYQIDRESVPQFARSSTLEFRELADVITQLINKSRDAYASQKEFTENAAHELQTPLAICRTKLELLAQSKDLTKEQADLIESMLYAMDRIGRLNKDLLLLSKIDNRQFIETTNVNIKAIVMKSIDGFQHLAKKKKLEIHVRLDPSFIISANAELMDMLISNLVSNAIWHTPENGAIDISLNHSQLTVSNTGVPFQHPEKLFERFHRESRTTPGTGLGLSIVKKIAEVSGFTISYSFRLEMHRFSVAFR